MHCLCVQKVKGKLYLELIGFQNLPHQLLNSGFPDCHSRYAPERVPHAVSESFHLLFVELILLKFAASSTLFGLNPPEYLFVSFRGWTRD